MYCPKEATRTQKLEFLNQLGEKVLNPYIEKCYHELGDYMNAFEHKLKMKRENIIDNMVSVAKKAYVMAVFDSEGVRFSVENPYLKIMGLQLVKSSTPKVIQQALRDSIPILLNKTEKEMQEYVREFREKYKDFTIEQIAFPRGVTSISDFKRENIEKKLAKEKNADNQKKLKDRLDFPSDLYVKGTPIHVRASLIYNHLLEKHGLNNVIKPIGDNDKIRFLYLNMPNPIHEDCVAFQEHLPEQFELDQYVNYDLMFEKTFLSNIEKMIAPLGWKAVQETYLEDFFEF